MQHAVYTRAASINNENTKNCARSGITGVGLLWYLFECCKSETQLGVELLEHSAYV